MITVQLLEKDDWVIINDEQRYGQVKKDQKRDSQDVTVENPILGTKVYLFEDLTFIEGHVMSPVCPKCGKIITVGTNSEWCTDEENCGWDHEK